MRRIRCLDCRAGSFFNQSLPQLVAVATVIPDFGKGEMRPRSVGLAGLLLLALATPAFAQQGTSEIEGRVTDEQGGALRGVAIVLTNEETGVVVRRTTSGSNGGYAASQLPPGRYC